MSSIEKAMERLGKGGRKEERSGTTRPEPRDASHGAESGDVLTVDRDRLRRAGMLTPDSADNRLVEQYRQLKRPLLMNAFGKGASPPVPLGNIVMITSALPYEGKTFSCVNLAMSIAMEMDTTVLLVDGDVLNPSITGLFGAESRPGLMDSLGRENLDLSSVIVRTDIPRLRILPSGRPQESSTELLASDQMRSLVEELSERYHDRIVIFDSPPLLVSSQADVLADIVGQVVVVVEAGRTAQHEIRDAVSHLDRRKPIGLLLNKSRRASKRENYGRYYGRSAPD